jgi:hypothetical protein
MNCDWVQQNITLYLYGELADDARHELEQHVARCQVCAAELADQREFQAQLNALPMEEPSASFLAAARMRLQEALEQTNPYRAWYHRFAFDPSAWLRQVRFSPALAMVIFMVGFGGGLGAMYQSMRHNQGGIVAPQTENFQGAAIGGVTAIERDPSSNTVKVQYDRVMPGSVQGDINDPHVKDLLLFAAKSDENSGVRLNSLEGLSNFVKDDIRVRNAVLEALLNDSNLGVRSGALHALEPVKADSSVRMALQQMAKEDPSEYIRTESKRLLASMPTVY